MTLNHRESEEPIGLGMVMLAGAIAGALSAVAVAMIAGKRPRRRSQLSGPPGLATSREVETFDSAGGGHFPPGHGAGGGHFPATSPPGGGGHGNPPPGGGHGGGTAGGGHGGGGGTAGGGHGGQPGGGGHG